MLPLLEARGMRAVVFVVTNDIGQPDYLTWDELRDMSRRGIEIGSHTANHQPLTGMTAQERASSNPKMLIKDSRKRRIAKGSGTRVQDVNRLLKQFTDMQKMMKQAKKMQGNKRRGFLPRLPF